MFSVARFPTMDARLLKLVALCAAVAAVCGQAGAPGRKQQAARRPASTTKRPTTEAAGADDTTDECPEPNGYFADAYQCDKYYECIDGVITEKLCADGMVFNDFSPMHEKCDLPFNIDCSQRPELQEPQPSLHCPRKNGYFAHEEPHTCDKFYYCVDGKFNMISCPDGLVYNERTGICTWPDEAKKKGCSSEDVFKFSCPKVATTEAQQHPRYADPEDCQYFYVCINGEVPRRNGCKMGQVFNDGSKTCDWPRNVPECAEWYKGILTDEQLAELEAPKPKNRTRGEEYKTRNGGGKLRPIEVE
ncbi:Protein obstructor-E [Cryptotermes secundus]|uniref:Protein obstructor-E n=2 Tax=Cryptotermes secundus TaxID=105785 RepID=A0A2J7PZW1_9NEOP|nr:Protein obstructor-E [Cryptotermes secundus]